VPLGDSRAISHHGLVRSSTRSRPTHNTPVRSSTASRKSDSAVVCESTASRKSDSAVVCESTASRKSDSALVRSWTRERFVTRRVTDDQAALAPDTRRWLLGPRCSTRAICRPSRVDEALRAANYWPLHRLFHAASLPLAKLRFCTTRSRCSLGRSWRSSSFSQRTLHCSYRPM
jgi:hypothetical protein